MAVITTEKLSATVGALVEGVDRERLLSDDDAPRPGCLEALEANGALVFRGLHLDDETQVAFSRKLGKVEKLGHGEHPEIFRVTLDPAKNPAAAVPQGHVRLAHRRLHRRHPDHGDDAQRPRRGRVRRRDRVRQHATPPTRRSTDDEKAAPRVAPGRAHDRGLAAPPQPRPHPPRRWRCWRRRPPKEHPLVWTHRSGRKSLVLGATTDHVVGMDRDEGRALLQDLLDRATTPDRVYRHEWEVGDVVIWDNRGVLHRACPYDPTSPRDMHRTTFAGDEPIQ